MEHLITHLNFDTTIFLVFLTANLLVGLKYGTKVKNIKDYALGGQNFSTGTLVATIVATYVGGGMFFTTLSKTYSDGLFYLIASSFSAFALVLIAFIFVPKMNNFLGKTTIAEVMGEYYGQDVRILTAIAAAVGAVGTIAIQFRAFGNVVGYFFNIPSESIIIIAGLIVTIYSAFGGIKAVTFTDVLQFLTFGCAIPLIGVVLWNQLYHVPDFTLTAALQDPKFNIQEVLNIHNPRFWEMIPLMLYFIMPSMEPELCQRVAIGKNLTQVKKAFLISAALVIFVKLTLAWVPFLVYNINPDLQGGKVLSFIIDNYAYPGFKGLVIVGVVAMAMSTADSVINTTSVLFSHDICRPLGIINSDKYDLIASKLFAFALGIGGILFAMRNTDLLQIVLTANSFYMPVVVVPLMTTILGFRTTTKPVLIGMAAGLSTTIIWLILDIQIDGIVIAMCVNLVFLLISHYIINPRNKQGPTLPENFNPDSTSTLPSLAGRFNDRISQFNFIEFCKNNSPQSELTYMGFGIYCIFYTFSTMYSGYAHQAELLKAKGDIILPFYQIMLVTGTCVAMYPIWPQRIKKDIVMQIAWNFLVFYMLVFFSCFFVMFSDFSRLQFAVFTINMILTFMLVGWRLAAIMTIIGFFLSINLYKNYIGYADLDTGSPVFMFMYVLMLVGTAVVIFFKPKEELRELAQERVTHLGSRIYNREEELTNAITMKSAFLKNLNHEIHAPMTGIISLGQSLADNYSMLNEEQKYGAIKTIAKSSERLQSLIDNMMNLSKLVTQEYKFNMKPLDLGELVKGSLKACKKLYIDEDQRNEVEFVLDVDKSVTVKCDPYYMKHIIDNLIINAITYCKKGQVSLSLKTDGTFAFFSIKDEGIGIPEKELDYIFEEFTVSSITRNESGGRGIGLALCKRVIELHQGKIWAENNSSSGATFKFIIPCRRLEENPE